ncbi:MAG: sulfurtransferase TusA family protein [Sphingobium sp.]
MTRNAEDGPLPAPVVVDARGMRCPWPVLRAARAMRANDHVLLLADDPIALKEVPDMASARGWRCGVLREDSCTKFILKK